SRANLQVTDGSPLASQQKIYRRCQISAEMIKKKFSAVLNKIFAIIVVSIPENSDFFIRIAGTSVP
ncbi:MAG: hypothetical protein V1897_08115, partial [Pseudomonadota bacterium]